jgi:hypothetical protein
MGQDLAIIEDEKTHIYLNHEYVYMSDDKLYLILRIAEDIKIPIFFRMKDSYEDYEVKNEELGEWLQEIKNIIKNISNLDYFNFLINKLSKSDGVAFDKSIFSQEDLIIFFHKLEKLIIKAKKINKSVWLIAE